MSVFSNSRSWVYPLRISGRFSRYHNVSSLALVLFLVIVPWLRWNGRPLFLADVPARHLTIFGGLYTASDGIFIMLFALLAAFSLFFFTALFGRLWCGYACPQSVLQINFVLRVEEWLEGDRSTRKHRNDSGWTFDLAWRKGLKWTIYAAVAWLLSMSFMGFFVPAEVLWTWQAGGTAYGIVGFFTFLWFWDFAWFREQVCNYVCPYARFQSALTDRHSWMISYDPKRGEPRGKAARATGGCIDCKKCVAVCPQGIDIRDGFQLECIACGKCVDACEDVMSRTGHKTLVRYSSFALDAGQSHKWIRARTVIYGAILTAVSAGIVVNVGLHAPLEVMVARMPGSLFIEDGDGFIRNTFMVQIADRTMTDGVHKLGIDVHGLPPGSEVLFQPIEVRAAEAKSLPVVVRVPRAIATDTLPISLHVIGDGLDVAYEATFKGPGSGSHTE